MKQRATTKENLNEMNYLCAPPTGQSPFHRAKQGGPPDLNKYNPPTMSRYILNFLWEQRYSCEGLRITHEIILDTCGITLPKDGSLKDRTARAEKAILWLIKHQYILIKKEPCLENESILEYNQARTDKTSCLQDDTFQDMVTHFFPKWTKLLDQIPAQGSASKN